MVRKINFRKSQYLGIALLVLFSIGIVRFTFHALSDAREIALTLGEPWEDMRLRSSAVISPAIPDEIWFAMPKSDAKLRFIDPNYGFETPLARFFTIGFIDGRVRNIRISPQVEPLLLDDALKVVLDLQDQWRRHGWFVSRPKSDPPMEDTPEGRNRVQGVLGGRTYWQAEEKYQILLMLNRFQDDKHPNEERYLISMSLAEPWAPRDED